MTVRPWSPRRSAPGSSAGCSRRCRRRPRRSASDAVVAEVDADAAVRVDRRCRGSTTPVVVPSVTITPSWPLNAIGCRRRGRCRRWCCSARSPRSGLRVAERAGAAGGGADVVAEDHVQRRVPPSRISMPSSLPEMTFRSRLLVPPIVLAFAPVWMRTPSALPRSTVPVGVGADVVAEDAVAASRSAGEHHAGLPLPEITFRSFGPVPPIVLLEPLTSMPCALLPSATAPSRRGRCSSRRSRCRCCCR